MIDDPLVSIVVTTYNRSHLLKRALQSLMNQTYPHLEIIVVDDGSTDDTKEVVSHFLEKDARMTYIYQENSGARARPVNRGIKHSSGDFIAFLDSDDEYLPWKIELQVKKMLQQEQQSDVGLMGTDGYIVRNRDGKIIGTIINPPPERVLDHLLGGKDILNPGVMVKRDVFDEIGYFDERLTCYEDLDFWLRALEGGFQFDFVRKPSYKYHVHPTNINLTTTPRKRACDYDLVMKKHWKSYLQKEFAEPMMFYVGLQFLLARDLERARHYFHLLRGNEDGKLLGTLGEILYRTLKRDSLYRLLMTSFQFYSKNFIFLDRKLVKL